MSNEKLLPNDVLELANQNVEAIRCRVRRLLEEKIAGGVEYPYVFKCNEEGLFVTEDVRMTEDALRRALTTITDEYGESEGRLLGVDEKVKDGVVVVSMYIVRPWYCL